MLGVQHLFVLTRTVNKEWCSWDKEQVEKYNPCISVSKVLLEGSDDRRIPTRVDCSSRNLLQDEIVRLVWT